MAHFSASNYAAIRSQPGTDVMVCKVAVGHLDEATPHLHIDYIPLGHYSRGLEVRNAKNKALDEMGFGNDAHSNNRWRLSEWKVLHDICTKHGFEIQPLRSVSEISKPTLSN